MKARCPHCGEALPETAVASCPSCGKELETLPPVSAAAGTENEFETLAETLSELPTISEVESADEPYLKKGVMTPPSRPGIRGNLGRFELLRLLGRGGMGYVYLAREPMTDTQVAVKVLRQELSEHPKVTKYFMTEARHMYAMSHPNILKVLEVSESERGPFFVMPYVKGGSLRDRLQGKQPMPSAEILQVGIQVAQGLVYAHNKGLIHRDLKPDNVLIDDQQRVMITDFGLVRSFQGDELLDMKQTAAEGTPSYMSPGVAAGQAEDTRCDIYAFGAMMYEMLTGHLPFTGASVDEILESIRRGPPVPALKMNADANKHLVQIAETAMARELRDRYATMSDVLEDLQRVEKGQAPIGKHGQAVRRNFAPLIRYALPGGILLLLGLLAIEMLTSPGTPPPPPPSPPPTPVPTPELLSAQERYEQGLAFLAEEKFLEAEEVLAQVVTIEPGHVEAWMRLGDSYLAQGKTLSARISYDKVTRLRVNDREAIRGLANAFKMENKPHDYTRMLAWMFRLDPGDDAVAQELLGQLVGVGHAGPSRATLESWKRQNPENPAVAEWETKVQELEARAPVSPSIPPRPLNPPSIN